MQPCNGFVIPNAQANMGTGDLKAAFGPRRHELSVSTYQMVILLLFNDVDSMSYRDIASATEVCRCHGTWQSALAVVE